MHVSFPVRYIPAWFPGAKFKRHALRTRKLVNESMSKPFDFVKRSRVSQSHNV